jgi:hypothetical protein
LFACVLGAAAIALAPAAHAKRARAPKPPPPPAWGVPVDAFVDARVRAPWRGGINERLVDVTDPFVGAPYAISPLGEGSGKDPDPRMRFDAFDCTTFVETALALALGRDLDDARAVLDSIRYRGAVVAFDERRHFPEAEWIPGLERAGLLEDVTKAVGGDDVTTEKKVLDAAAWKRARGKNLPDLAPERVPTGTFALDVWKLAAAAAHPERIPAGTVLYVVRVDFKNVPVRVSHQGLVVEKDGKRFLRHAADRGHHHVVDEPLDRFFARIEHYARWPVAGVHLTQIVPAPDWRARLGITASAAATTTDPTTDPTTTP